MERTWLIELRIKLGFTQEHVADLCGIKRPYYTMIETGKRRPSVEVAQKIASVIGFNWVIFFDQNGNETILSIKTS
ncbi:helix-turn-helix transcriptional regulator [Paenibacillus tyrfis]|uniref:XRE family transcriptional regulator n=1 Tax=Paenibacillus tyrfis TaxID=1501230 RepID=A0A081NWM7_9BACL|nr:helix-turn-helix transcriptional regulator [Paenibacillus tyrfis]KEQ22850.1 XRE family transcriptional regulator [Paenibacillus tyrfis]